MNGDYRFWIVSKAYPKAFDTSIQGNAALPHGERKAMKKKTVKLHLNDGRYTGNLVTLGNLTYGVDAETLKPYLLIGEDRWDSQNKLATSDTWATGGDSRTNGLWMEPQRLSRCVLTFSYDPPFLTVYRDGIIDMHIDVDEYGKHYGTNNYRHLW